MFGESGTVCFFPAASGSQLTKRHVVASIEAVALGQGLPLTSENGQRRFGGHTCRVAGSQYLASIGLELALIQLLGRWESAVILRYVMEAPLASITQSFRDKVMGAQLHEVVGALARGERHQIEKLATVEEQQALRKEVALKLADEDDRPAQEFAVNSFSAIVHIVLQGFGPRDSWATRCSWPFGATEASSSSSQGRFRSRPEGAGCKRCFRQARGGGNRAEPATSGSSISPSSGSTSS